MLSNRGAKRLINRLVVLCLIGVAVYAVVEFRRAHDSAPATPAASRRAEPGAPSAKGVSTPGFRPEEIRVMAWNIEWFQDPKHGPADDARQYQAVKQVLQDSGMSIIGLVEIASPSDFERLLVDLKGYSGLLSTYKQSQKVGLLYSNTRFELVGYKELTELSSAGRSPLEANLRRRSDGLQLYVIVVHAKAMSDLNSYRQRARFSENLKAYLDRERARVPLMVLGDFNDMLSGSITASMASPYQNFVDDPAYFAATRALNTAPGSESSGSWGQTIDHILVSDELAPRVVEGSIDVLQKELEPRFSGFAKSVSDHYPVTLTLKF